MAFQPPPGHGSGHPGGFPYPQPGFPGGSPYPPQGVPQPHVPSPAPPTGGAVAITDTTGSYEGVQYRIDHRDSNSLLSLRLHPEYVVKGKPGSMVAMDASVKIRGKVSSPILIICNPTDRRSQT